MSSKANVLRQLFDTKPIVSIVGAHNAMGAKLIESAGFDGIWASGLEISTAHGVPDANILTMTENLEEAQSMNEATSLPIICDCDTGFGNAANVIHMVKKYEAAGLAAVVIEDKRFPKVNSFIPGRQELAPIEEFMGKIEAAKNAQHSKDFFVIARIEALIAGWGLDEALRRASAYKEAGADAIVIHSKATTPSEIFTFAKQWKSQLPLVAIPTTYYSVTAQELAENGFKMVIYANHGIRSAIRAMRETFSAIKQSGSSAPVETKIASMKEVFELQGMTAMKEDEKKFVRKEGILAVIPAASTHASQLDLSKHLKDKPLCMLELAGRPLIEIQMDMLRSAGVTDIYVVGGYLADKIKIQSATLIQNPNYEKFHSAYTIMCALPYMTQKTLIVYSDILYDRLIIDQLLDSPHQITIVMDRAYQSLPSREKKLDLVASSRETLLTTGRKLDLDFFKTVNKIGKNLDPSSATHEFIGVAFFREEGIKALKSAWTDALKEYASQPFFEAASAEKAGFTDLLQFLISRGYPIHGMEINHGWSEVHSEDDYLRINNYFQRV